MSARDAELARVLYLEAQLLDEGRFADWLHLLAPDLRYWAPVRADLARADEQAGEAGRLPLFDETRETLALRVQRLSTGLAWSETPPTRTCRLVGNVTADDDGDGRLLVRSNLIVFRGRSPGDDVLLAGARQDRWSRDGESWLLHERRILLVQRLVENLSILL